MGDRGPFGPPPSRDGYHDQYNRPPPQDGYHDQYHRPPPRDGYHDQYYRPPPPAPGPPPDHRGGGGDGGYHHRYPDRGNPFSSHPPTGPPRPYRGGSSYRSTKPDQWNASHPPTWDNTMDLGENNYPIYDYIDRDMMSDPLQEFHRNAVEDVDPTASTNHRPDNCTLCDDKCALCGDEVCKMVYYKHVLSKCNYSLKIKNMYTWRHDTVLRIIASTLSEQLKMYNKRDVSVNDNPVVFLERANDWEIMDMVDEDRYQKGFPQHIYESAQRPDIVVWSDKTSLVILIELTVGHETNFEYQAHGKEARYNEELIPGIESWEWNVELFTVEVGCRGGYHHTDTELALFNYFGVAENQKRELLETAAITALRCSYKIWLKREDKDWVPSPSSYLYP